MYTTYFDFCSRQNRYFVHIIFTYYTNILNFLFNNVMKDYFAKKNGK